MPVAPPAEKVPLLGMRIEKATPDEVVTTGARFEIKHRDRAIICYQRIPEERELGSVTFDVSLSGLRVERADMWTAVLKSRHDSLPIGRLRARFL